MADIETWYFYLLEFDDFDEVKKTGCPYVLTTTFLITVKLKNGKTS